MCFRFSSSIMLVGTYLQVCLNAIPNVGGSWKGSSATVFELALKCPCVCVMANRYTINLSCTCNVKNLSLENFVQFPVGSYRRMSGVDHPQTTCYIQTGRKKC